MRSGLVRILCQSGIGGRGSMSAVPGQKESRSASPAPSGETVGETLSPSG